MRHYFILLWLLFLFACDSSTPSSSNHNSIPPSKSTIPNTGNSSSSLSPFTFSFLGLVNQELIEIHLSCPPTIPRENDCIKIVGDYIFVNQNASSKKITGTFCPQTGDLSLVCKKKGLVIERINGKVLGNFHSLEGDWHILKSGLQTTFKLNRKSLEIPEKAKNIFANKLAQHLRQNNNFAVKNIDIKSNEVQLIEVDHSKINIKNFSSFQFEWSYSKEEKQRIDFEESLDLWFYNDTEDFVIVIYNTTWKEIEGKEESEVNEIEVWKMNGNKLENIFVQIPNQVDLSQYEWYAIKKNNVIQLYQNQMNGLWEWHY